MEKYFSGIPAGPALDRPPKWIPPLDGPKVIEVSDRVPQERTYFAWVAPAYFDPGDAELDLVVSILTGGLSARLNKTLVYEKRLCSDISATTLGLESAGGFLIWATARPGASMPEIEQIITGEIARLAREGPTLEELRRAQIKWEYEYVTGLERIGGFGGKADRLNQYNVYPGDPKKFESDVARHRKPTPADIRNVVATWLATSNRLTVRFRPEPSGKPAEVALDRSKEPPLAADRPFMAPKVLTARLSNGMVVYVVERHDLPKVAVRLYTRAGSVDDGARQAGIASLTAGTLRMGTKIRKALEIDEQMGDLGTSLGAWADTESAGLSVEVLKRNLAPALAIMADVAMNPAFPASEVDLQKKPLQQGKGEVLS